MPNEHGDDGQSASATQTMSRPTIPPDFDDQLPRTDPVTPAEPRAASNDQPRALLVAAGIVALLVAVLLVSFASGGSSSAGAQTVETATTQPQATATLSPTATSTASSFPQPTPMIGFKVYVDQANGFLLQYPDGWASTPLTGEVDFQDTANADISFEMFLLTPDAGLISSQGTDVQTAGAWVDHVLDTESSLHAGAFVRIPGPMPSGTFAGAEWQSGEGLLGDGSAQVRIQVFVTIHEDNPYVIGIAAADSAFDFATQDYFESMLQSFAFLPSNP